MTLKITVPDREIGSLKVGDEASSVKERVGLLMTSQFGPDPRELTRMSSQMESQGIVVIQGVSNQFGKTQGTKQGSGDTRGKVTTQESHHWHTGPERVNGSGVAVDS